MKKSFLMFVWFMLFLSLGACDKAGDQMSLGTVAPEAVSGGLVILNNLAETISVLDSSGAIHNNVQVTGRSPNHILFDEPYLYIVNSLSNSIEVLSAKDLSIIKEISAGTGKNPMFAAVVGDRMLAVTEFKEGSLDIVDVGHGRVIYSVDLTTIELPRDNKEDVAGSCYPYGVAANNGKIFVTLANLTDHYGGLTAAGPGVVAVIDASSYEIIETIELQGADPVFAANFGNKVIIACAGHYEGDITSPRPSGFKGDGTIEIIDTETSKLETTYYLEDSAPFSFSISGDNILYASNAMGSGIPRVNLLTNEVMDNLELGSTFISAVFASGDTIYALDFSKDLLFALNKQGDVLGTYLVGDGPIAMLSLAEVSAEGHIIPVIKVSPPIASPGVDITFDASASVLPDGDYTFSWGFGDGSPSKEGIMVVHAYNDNARGQYTVTLTVTDNTGGTATKKCIVYIAEKFPFATEVIDYSPAPGQFIDNPQFNDPDRALGPPVGGGLGQGDTTSQVSLGGFGGYIILKFDHWVMDNPENLENPLGLDFIVFGNAFGGWVEPGVVEISDDPKVEEDPDQARWYLIPGTAMEPPYELVEKDYGEPYGVFSAYQIPPETGYVNPDTGEVNWGYADFSPVMALPEGADPAVFYTNPDNPYIIGTDEGSCGGDAFDIAWALDPKTGKSAGLEGFQYIKITTGVDYYSETLGEISTEVDAVADVGLDENRGQGPGVSLR